MDAPRDIRVVALAGQPPRPCKQVKYAMRLPRKQERQYNRNTGILLAALASSNTWGTRSQHQIAHMLDTTGLVRRRNRTATVARLPQRARFCSELGGGFRFSWQSPLGNAPLLRDSPTPVRGPSTLRRPCKLPSAFLGRSSSASQWPPLPSHCDPRLSRGGRAKCGLECSSRRTNDASGAVGASP